MYATSIVKFLLYSHHFGILEHLLERREFTDRLIPSDYIDMLFLPHINTQIVDFLTSSPIYMMLLTESVQIINLRELIQTQQVNFRIWNRLDPSYISNYLFMKACAANYGNIVSSLSSMVSIQTFLSGVSLITNKNFQKTLLSSHDALRGVETALHLGFNLQSEITDPNALEILKTAVSPFKSLYPLLYFHLVNKNSHR
jgi:hypothetical protein